MSWIKPGVEVAAGPEHHAREGRVVEVLEDRTYGVLVRWDDGGVSWERAETLVPE